MKEITAKYIEDGNAVIGIELGSTRIKAVMIDSDFKPIASGSHTWETRLENGVWTYSKEEIIDGLQDAYADLKKQIKDEYGVVLKKAAAIGISAMMHGYLAFDKKGSLLVPFRTWRNAITEEAAAVLSDLFKFNVPQRWSISHLYQAILNKESHVKDISYMTTLSGYIHRLISGRKVLGVGDASGMFPIDSETKTYNSRYIELFNELVKEKNFDWKVEEILPEVLCAGDDAGVLTEEGAKLLDPSGDLEAGITLCPPEGDAGTGMTATNSVARRTGNVSAGTSIFSMVVLEKPLKDYYKEIDIVTTPAGDDVAMVHCSNCTSDINDWAGLIKDSLEAFGMKVSMNDLFTTLYKKAMEGEKDAGGLLSYNYISGETITDLEDGRPLVVRKPGSRLNLGNFMRMHLMSALATLRIGNDILFDKENIPVDKLYGHGGYFKTEGVGQNLLAAALKTPVYVMKTAGEGGAWGIALLAAYEIRKNKTVSLPDFLALEVFKGDEGLSKAPDQEDMEGFDAFMNSYRAGLGIEKAAVKW